MIRQNINAYKVKNLLGHSSCQVTEHYLHIVNNEFRDEMEEYQKGIGTNSEDDN